jgi:hypothetical protein
MRTATVLLLRRCQQLRQQPQHLRRDNACKMGLEKIVWKRLGSRYRSKFKNSEAPAVRREAEGDLGS